MYSTVIFETIICIGICVILPITIVAIVLSFILKKQKTKKEIVLAALEKNADINVEDLVKNMNKPNKLLKEKLLRKMQWGLITAFPGIGLLVTAAIMGFVLGEPVKTIWLFCIVGFLLLAIGAAFLVSYYVGKKLLAKEIEAEQQDLMA